MKEVLISIRPEWCAKIANGEKTFEVRKTKPNINSPFKCYIYCTANAPWLVYGDVLKNGYVAEEYTVTRGRSKKDAEKIWGVMNGKVIGEFMCDFIEPYWFMPGDNGIEEFEDVQLACLSAEEIIQYGKGRQLEFWHISDLVIYDEPKSVGEFNHCGENYHFNPPITRPPQSWCYVEETP